jgi:hypothetical protein
MPKKPPKSHNITKATPDDARLILKLYDLRREEKMREARDFMAQDFWPESYDDFIKLIGTPGTDQNRHFRQTMTYWDMASSLVVHGALNYDLFLANSGEMYYFYAKIKPYLKELRQKLGQWTYIQHIEKVVEGSPKGREKLATVEQSIAKLVEMKKAAAADAR